LGRSLVAGAYQTVFHNAAFKHPSNDSYQPLVSYSVLQKFEHPAVINVVEKAFNIGLQDKIHTLLLNDPSQGVQTLVLTAAWSVAVGLSNSMSTNLRKNLHRWRR